MDSFNPIFLDNLKKLLNKKGLEISYEELEEVLESLLKTDLKKNKKIIILEQVLIKNAQLVSLVENLTSLPGHLIIKELHLRLKHTVEEKNHLTDPYGISQVVNWTNKGKIAVMTKLGLIKNKLDYHKINSKHIRKLSKAMEVYGCTRGILYTSLEDIPATLYKQAIDCNIEIVDFEDLLRLAHQIDEKNKPNFEFNKLLFKKQ